MVQRGLKLVAEARGGAQDDAPPVLTWLEAYRLDADPGEVDNLVIEGKVPSGFEELRDRLVQAVENWAELKFFDRATAELSPEDEERLRAMGYLD